MRAFQTLLALAFLAVAGWLAWEVVAGRTGVPAAAGVLYGTGIAVFLLSFVFDLYMGCIAWAWPLAGVVLLAKSLEPDQSPWLFVPSLIGMPIVAGVLLMAARSGGAGARSDGDRGGEP